MFQRFRHQLLREEQPLQEPAAEGARGHESAESKWLRRPVFGRHNDRDVSAHLERELSGMGAVLHDVRLPDTTLPIDHVVVAPSGIWLIETAHVAGRLTHRATGPRRKSSSTVLLDGVDRTMLVDSVGALSAARDAVVAMELNVDIQTATCLVDATWPVSAHPFKVNGHWVTWPRALTDKIQSFGLLPIKTAHDIADAISDPRNNAPAALAS